MPFDLWRTVRGVSRRSVGSFGFAPLCFWVRTEGRIHYSRRVSFENHWSHKCNLVCDARFVGPAAGRLAPLASRHCVPGTHQGTNVLQSACFFGILKTVEVTITIWFVTHGSWGQPPVGRHFLWLRAARSRICHAGGRAAFAASGRWVGGHLIHSCANPHPTHHPLIPSHPDGVASRLCPKSFKVCAPLQPQNQAAMDYLALSYQHEQRNLDRYIENLIRDMRRQLKEQRNGLRKRFGKISKRICRMARPFKKYRRLELFCLWDPTFES